MPHLAHIPSKFEVAMQNPRRRAAYARKEKIVKGILNGKSHAEIAKEAGCAIGSVAILANRAFNDKNIQANMKLATMRLDEQIIGSFQWKIDKLVKVVNRGVPDSDEKALDTPIDMTKLALTSIAEMNKMAGHYAPDKSISATLGVDAGCDIEKMKKLEEELTQQHKKEY